MEKRKLVTPGIDSFLGKVIFGRNIKRISLLFQMPEEKTQTLTTNSSNISGIAGVTGDS